jgi:hypothetical protein
MNASRATILFAIAAVYDGVLGVAFLLFPAALYERFGVVPPNHWGYVDFAAAILVIFAMMFIQVARDPRSNRNLIPYGVLLKVAYCGVVFRYWFAVDLPNLWKPFAVADVAFAVLFVWAYVALKPAVRPGSDAAVTPRAT